MSATLQQGGMEELKVFCFWDSPYSCRVIWALKLKGIPYEYIEEDLPNKSPQLLKHNPVHKKVPVLVHGGKPICESMVILEYIEQMWPDSKPLLPQDPYQRAVARFWVKFVDDKLPNVWKLYRTSGDEQEKAIKESLEMLRAIEDHCLKDTEFFGGDQEIGLVDIALGGIAHWLEVIEDVIGVKLLEPHTFPLLHAWIENFKEVPVIRDNLPNRDQVFVLLSGHRERLLASSRD